MKYAIYYTCNDGFEDSFNVDNAEKRNISIKRMIISEDFKHISYSKIYASGEYGKRVNVL